MRTRRKAGPHGVRNPCAEHPASLSDLAGTLFSGCHGADRFRDCLLRRPTPRNPSASCLSVMAQPTRVPRAGRSRRTPYRRRPLDETNAVILEGASLRDRSGIQRKKGRRLSIASSTTLALDPRPSTRLRLARPRMTVSLRRADGSTEKSRPAQTTMSERARRSRHNKATRPRE